MVGKFLAEEPATEMVDDFAGDCWVFAVEMSFFHCLKNVIENSVHHHWQVGSAVIFAEFLIFFDLVESISDIDGKLLYEFLSIFAEILFYFQQKLSQDVIDDGGIGVIELKFLLFFMFFPIIFDGFYIELIILAEFF